MRVVNRHTTDFEPFVYLVGFGDMDAPPKPLKEVGFVGYRWDGGPDTHRGRFGGVVCVGHRNCDSDPGALKVRVVVEVEMPAVFIGDFGELTAQLSQREDFPAPGKQCIRRVQCRSWVCLGRPCAHDGGCGVLSWSCFAAVQDVGAVAHSPVRTSNVCRRRDARYRPAPRTRCPAGRGASRSR